MDVSVSMDELIALVVDVGGCSADEVKVSPFRPMADGLLATWVQCPLSAANNLARKGKVRIVWTMARVDLLRARPTQCFRCWLFGHVREQCRSSVDRSKCCFRCGKDGHTARACNAPVHCVVCADNGLNSTHRIGSMGIMSDASDMAVRCVKANPRRCSAYWWNEEISDARRRCIAARRRWTRRRHRAPDADRIALEAAYRSAKRDLRALIRAAKAKSWEELVKSVDDDPWGLPYKLVLEKLRRISPALIETLQEGPLEVLLHSLFPDGETHNPVELWEDWDGLQPDEAVSSLEVYEAIQSGRKSGCPSPGPDGITIVMWRRAAGVVSNPLSTLFTACLRDGVFPTSW
ncbi:hypothetical protein DMN91_006521, partial [Ooceraea biroi]